MRALFTALATSHGVSAFYTPGLLQKDYALTDPIVIEASTIDSAVTHVPYDYFNDANMCKPAGVSKSSYRLGSALLGENWQETSMQIKVGKGV